MAVEYFVELNTPAGKQSVEDEFSSLRFLFSAYWVKDT